MLYRVVAQISETNDRQGILSALRNHNKTGSAIPFFFLFLLTDDSTVSYPKRYPCEASSVDYQPNPWKQPFLSILIKFFSLFFFFLFFSNVNRRRMEEKDGRKAYNFNTSRGTSCAAGRSNRSCLQQDTNFISGWHLHGPSAQISQSSSPELICQTE